MEILLVSTSADRDSERPRIHFAVAESVDGFYTTNKDPTDRFIKYAKIDPTSGELVPSDFIVGRDDPLVNDLPGRVTEEAHVR